MSSLMDEFEAQDKENIDLPKSDFMAEFEGQDSQGTSLMDEFEQFDSQSQMVPEKDYGLRMDGTPKGSGYLGEIKTPKGDIATEVSIGVDYGKGETLIPLLVPTLTPEEVKKVVSGDEIPRSIADKAVEHAIKREKEGKSVWADSLSPKEWQERTVKFDEIERTLEGRAEKFGEIREPTLKEKYVQPFKRFIGEQPALQAGAFTGGVAKSLVEKYVPDATPILNKAAEFFGVKPENVKEEMFEIPKWVDYIPGFKGMSGKFGVRTLFEMPKAIAAELAGYIFNLNTVVLGELSTGALNTPRGQAFMGTDIGKGFFKRAAENFKNMPGPKGGELKVQTPDQIQKALKENPDFAGAVARQARHDLALKTALKGATEKVVKVKPVAKKPVAPVVKPTVKEPVVTKEAIPLKPKVTEAEALKASTRALDTIKKSLTKENTERLAKDPKWKMSKDEEFAQKWIQENPDEAIKNYIEESIDKFQTPIVVSADVGKFAIPGMGEGKAAPYHEPGSALKNAREEVLLEDPNTMDLPGMFTAGGSGSGKSVGIEKVAKGIGKPLEGQFAIIHDTNLNSLPSAKKKIQAILDTGRDVDITYFFRDPMKAWEDGVLPRAVKSKRIVPLAEHINTHKGSGEVIKQLPEIFGDKIDIEMWDNSFGKNEEKLILGVDKIPKVDYPKLGSELFDSLIDFYISQKGKFSDKLFKEALVGSKWEAKAEQILDTIKKSQSGDQGGKADLQSLRSKVTTKKEIIKPSQEIPSQKKPIVKTKPAQGQKPTPETLKLPKKGFEVPEETITKLLQRKFQDKFSRLQTVQEEIGKTKPISEEQDANLAQELFHGRTKSKLDKFDREFVEPLKTELGRMKVDPSDLELYLYARHAPERNAHVQSINPKFKAEGGGSGLHTDVANEIVRRFHEKGMIPKLEKLATKIKDINNMRLDILEKSGLMSKEAVKALRDAYKNYVPLKGIDEPKSFSRVGKGFDIRGKESFRALGRTSAAKNLLGNTLIDFQETIIRADKNRVGQAFLELVRNNPNPDLWTINKQPSKPIFNENTGEVDIKRDPLFKLGDNILSVKENGQEYLIEMKDPALASAMKNLGADKTNVVVQGLARINRYLAAVNTQLNPEFILSNFSRDIQTAFINISGEQSLKSAKTVLKNTPAAIKGIWNVSRNPDATGHYEDKFKEYKNEGGKVEFFGLKDVETVQKDLIKSINEISNPNNKTKIKDAFKGFLNIIEDANTAVENGVRLATYEEAIAQGETPAKGASISKNITVNFNKKGELGSFFNSLYLFSNAGVQGTMRHFQALKNPRVQKLATAGVIGGVALAELNRQLGGQDPDDGEYYWDKIPDFEKERHLILMKPGTEGDYMKIPLPYGYNIYPAIGYSISNMMHGSSPMKESVNILRTVANAFNPLGSSDLIQTISPTIADPLVQLGMNKNFFGGKIRPDQFPFGAPKPQAELKFKGVSKISDKAATTLNEISGGSKFRSGKIDISPENMDHVVEFLTGGLGKFFNQSVSFAADAWTGKKTPVNKIPFVRKFLGKQNEFTSKADFRNNVNEITQIKKEYEYLKETSQIDADKFKKANEKLINLKARLDRFEKQIKRAADRNDDEGVIKLMKKFNREFNQAKKGIDL